MFMSKVFSDRIDRYEAKASKVRIILEQYANHLLGADGPYIDEDRAIELLAGKQPKEKKYKMSEERRKNISDAVKKKHRERSK